MPLQVDGSRVQVLGHLASSSLTGSIRKARELADIPPQYVTKSGLCSASELESARSGSMRIQHSTALSGIASSVATEGKSRFPKLDECAHFHYEHVDIGPLKMTIVDEDDLKPLSNETEDGKWWSLSVTSQNKTWLIRRSYENFTMLDQQLHRCIYDRKFSELAELPAECIEEQENLHKILSDYVSRFSAIAGSLINCGPILNWLELDNRGHRLLVPDTDNCPINTPAVAAAYSVKRYAAQAPDEISFEVGDMISVIDMPPPEESIWWRGKRGFQVGFFPCECVAVIGDKVPRNFRFSPRTSQPTKPVLRKHGKLIAFFRSFILSRPSRRRLKQSGILKERVFGCDLGEHLLNSGHEIPMVLKCCVEFIETNGLVDGIYRLSGITSNIQKLRNAFDEDRVPALYEDETILQDVHSVASLLKMYFRELPNPLCTYQLYHQFVGAVQASQGDDARLSRMRDVVQKLPPPHYRTLEYLMRHLARVSEKGHETGMTSRNVAIVWAPNLLRCKELEVGGVAALQGVGVQAVVTEFLVCYADLIFCDKLANISLPPQQASSKKSRPKSLAISTPTKLLSLEEARTRALLQAAGNADQDYIEVGGGPANLPAKYHTVIELPHSRKRMGSKRSPIGWKSLFSKSGRGSQTRKDADRKASTPSDLGLGSTKAVTESDLVQNRRRNLRPAKSVESLNSGRNSGTLDLIEPPLPGGPSSPEESDSSSPILMRNGEGKNNGHNRSVSHESYFDQLQDHQQEDTVLDISEIQVNFDLEESEMRIFSEDDETLISVGSGSLASNNSPKIMPFRKTGKSLAGNINKRLSYPKTFLEDVEFNGTQSADPSPKKQKIGDGTPPRSKLEEQLSSSVGDIQFIDSVSPDQVLVQVEVHPIQSPSPVSSISQITPSTMLPSSPILPHIPYLRKPASPLATRDRRIVGHFGLDERTDLPDSFSSSRTKVRDRVITSNETSPRACPTSPSPAEATVSENESFSLQSSELTTPDTPACRSYTPLVDLEDSSVSNATTPDFEADDKTRTCASESKSGDETWAKRNSEGLELCETAGGEELERFEDEFSCGSTGADSRETAHDNSWGVEIEAPPKPEERKQKPVRTYVNVPEPRFRPPAEPQKVLETNSDFKERPDEFPSSSNPSNSIISIKYECISTESSSDSLINVKKNEDEPLGGSPRRLFGSENSEKFIRETETADFFESFTDEKISLPSEMNLLTECNNWLESREFSFLGDDGSRHHRDFSIDEDAFRGGAPKSSTEALRTTATFDSSESSGNRETRARGSEKNKTAERAVEEGIIEEPLGQEEEKADERNIPEGCEKEEGKKVLETDLDEDLIGPEFPSEANSTQRSTAGGNVRRLLSEFERSSGCSADFEPDSPERKKDEEGSRSRKNRNANRKTIEERPKTLERSSNFRRTEIDPGESSSTQLEKSKSGSHVDVKRKEVLFGYDFDLTDPVRRERIEKYKEKRRNYLREKYRSESFKNERDDFASKIKHRHPRKTEREEYEGKPGLTRRVRDKKSPEKKNSRPEKGSGKPGPSLPILAGGSETLSKDPRPRRSFSGQSPSSTSSSSSSPSSSSSSPSPQGGFGDGSDSRSRVPGGFEGNESSGRILPKKNPYSLDSPGSGSGSGNDERPPASRFSARKRSSNSGKISLVSSNEPDRDVYTSDKLPREGTSAGSFSTNLTTALLENRDDSRTRKQYLSSV